jgi:hypothetical protein
MPVMRYRLSVSSTFLIGILFFALASPSYTAGQRSRANATPRISPDLRQALDRVSSDSLRGHLSFIASDALEGRGTPSPGLDMAAEYIAAQFRRAGLDPAGDDGFYQTANWKVLERNADAFELTLLFNQKTLRIRRDQVSAIGSEAVDISEAAVLKFGSGDYGLIDSLKPDQARNKIILVDLPNPRGAPAERRAETFRTRLNLLSKLRALKPASLVAIDRTGSRGRGVAPSTLIDPENRTAPRVGADQSVTTVIDPAFVEAFDQMDAGAVTAKVSLLAPPAEEKPVKLRNVIGVLRGSDPVLKDTYVIVTAHYDHLGSRPEGEGDRIYNGANDNGSGTGAIVELASALSTLKKRPRRSVVFMTFFGEERGLLGARYYGRHPVFPIEKTVANINLEQVGRTDSSEGPQKLTASLTGYDFSEVGSILKTAGAMTGITVYKHPTNSDSYFPRSDNQALADLGVPAHTLCVAFAYPDYHGLADHWEKIDYQNMAAVTRMVAVAVFLIAENPIEPKWNESNPKAERYLKAWRQRRQ